MPRDLAGNYTLPAGNPVVNNTLIESAWANSTLSDIATAINGAPTRDGKLGFTAPVNFGGIGTQVSTNIRFGFANSGLFGFGYSTHISYNGIDVFYTTAEGIRIDKLEANRTLVGLGSAAISTTLNDGPATAVVNTTGVGTYSFTMATALAYSIDYNAGAPIVTFGKPLVVETGTFSVTLAGASFNTRNGYSFVNTNSFNTVTWLQVLSDALSTVNFPSKLTYKGEEVAWVNAVTGSTDGATPPVVADRGKTLYINSNLTINGIFSTNDQFRILNVGNSTVTLTGASGLTALIDGATNTTSGTYSLPPKRLVTLIFLTANVVVIN